MFKGTSFNKDYFLNRLALGNMCEPASLDILETIDGILILEEEEMQTLFKGFCEAAISDRYTWQESSPGKLFYIIIKVEELIEVSYLILRSPENKLRGISEKLLSAIEEFFIHQSLPEWKLSLHYWTEAALSNFSVLDTIGESGLLPFSNHLKKLIHLSYEERMV